MAVRTPIDSNFSLPHTVQYRPIKDHAHNSRISHSGPAYPLAHWHIMKVRPRRTNGKQEPPC